MSNFKAEPRLLRETLNVERDECQILLGQKASDISNLINIHSVTQVMIVVFTPTGRSVRCGSAMEVKLLSWGRGFANAFHTSDSNSSVYIQTTSSQNELFQR